MDAMSKVTVRSLRQRSPAQCSSQVGWLRSAMHLMSSWIQRSSQRRRLAALSDREPKDLGLTRHDALHEARKPFWRRQE